MLLAAGSVDTMAEELKVKKLSRTSDSIGVRSHRNHFREKCLLRGTRRPAAVTRGLGLLSEESRRGAYIGALGMRDAFSSHFSRSPSKSTPSRGHDNAAVVE